MTETPKENKYIKYEKWFNKLVLNKKFLSNAQWGLDFIAFIKKIEQELAEQIFEEIDKQIFKETGKRIIRFKEIRNKCVLK